MHCLLSPSYEIINQPSPYYQIWCIIECTWCYNVLLSLLYNPVFKICQIGKKGSVTRPRFKRGLPERIFQGWSWVPTHELNHSAHALTTQATTWQNFKILQKWPPPPPSLSHFRPRTTKQKMRTSKKQMKKVYLKINEKSSFRKKIKKNGIVMIMWWSFLTCTICHVHLHAFLENTGVWISTKLWHPHTSPTMT